MSDLRMLRAKAAHLLSRPLVLPPTLEDVAARAQRVRVRQHRRRVGLVAAVVIAVGSARWVGTGPHAQLRLVNDPDTSRTTSSTEPHKDPVEVLIPRAAPQSGDRPTANPAGSVPVPVQQGAAIPEPCPPSDSPATGPPIKVFMGVPSGEPDRYPNGNASRVVYDVIDDANRAGGACGRRIDLVRDGPDAVPPADAVAMMFTPQNPALDRYLRERTADRLGLPIVGTDGLTAAQFASPWVFPVGLPVAGLTRVALDHAYDRMHARTFALVYDENSDFGREAVAAFRTYVASLPGASVRIEQALGQSDSQASAFNRACAGDACDVVVWAMTASQSDAWMNRNPAPGRLATSTLLLDTFHGLPYGCSVQRPVDPCRNLLAWSAFTPAVSAFVADKAVRDYRETAEAVNAWHSDPLTEGAYVGVNVLLDALRRTGPDVTRVRLRQTLEAMRFESSLVSPLRWGPLAPGQRVANHAARALRLQGGTFVDAGTGWVSDPTPGVFPH